MVKEWSMNPKWNPYRVKALRPFGIAAFFLGVVLGSLFWSGGATAAILLVPVGLANLMLVILGVVGEQVIMAQLQTVLPQERELAVFKNVRALYGMNYSFIADLHLTETRIYVTPNDQTKMRFLDLANRLSTDLAQVIRIEFHRHSRGRSGFTIGWKTGSHFWNRMWVSFQLSDETFEQARSIFPSIISLAGKVEV